MSIRGATPVGETTHLDNAPDRLVSPWLIGAVFWSTVIAIVVLRTSGVPENPTIGTFGVIFTSIVVEALPFILLGAAVSALIAVFVSDRMLARIGRLPRALQLPAASLAGVAFPVCECGSVPVGRRLIARGVYPAAGIGFMLAAPIVNPIVLGTTWVAYEGRGVAAEMTMLRGGLGLLVAIAAGWAIGRRSGVELLRESQQQIAVDAEHRDAHGSRSQAFADHLAGDFLFMGKFLVLGAAASATIQTLVPQSIVAGVADNPVLGALALMTLAFALSLCSEADAFVAVSFTSFSLGSQLAFLVLGPVLDTKLAVLYGATFRRQFAIRVLLVAAPVALAGALLADAVL
ncbi:MAG: uncharacterized protein QOG09_544 [Solirubrobacterales bacterium]|nr:uncharacterized protein [Solirubrobacterales bacterium]